MRKLILFVVIAAMVAVGGMSLLGIKTGQAKARELCQEQGKATLEATRALLSGNQRKITLEKADDLFNRLNKARTCMGKKQRLEATSLSMKLGRERAIILFQQPHCTTINVPVDGCTAKGWPANRPVPRQRFVHTTGL